MKADDDAKYYLANAPKIKARSNRWYYANRDKQRTIKVQQPKALKLLWAARSRARLKGLPCDIELEDVLIPDFCPVLGIPIVTTHKRFHPDSPSVDRIDPCKGYIKGNIQVMSWRANKLKSDATLEELEAVVNFMKK